MRIADGNLLMTHQTAVLVQRLDDLGIGELKDVVALWRLVQDVLALEARRMAIVFAIQVYRRPELVKITNTALIAGKIVHTVVGCGVNKTCAGIIGHVVCG